MPQVPARVARPLVAGVLVALVLASVLTVTSAREASVRFEVSYPASVEAGPLDGRVLLVVSRRGETEPRFQITRGPRTQQIFGVDVEGLTPGQVAVIDGTTRGYPMESALEIPPGEYVVQAVLNVYTTFSRADGHTIKAHMDQWEGQRWNVSPGNLLSEPQRYASTRVRAARSRSA